MISSELFSTPDEADDQTPDTNGEQSAILTVTANPSLDLVVDVAELVESGKNRAQQRAERPGGGGLNIAQIIDAFDGSATAVHSAAGLTGQRITALLEAAGIDHRTVWHDGRTRHAMILNETVTGRSHHIVPAAERPRRSPLPAIADIVRGLVDQPGTFVVVSGSLPPGSDDQWLAGLARWARDRSHRLVLDSSGPGVESALDVGVDLVRMNRSEATAWIGHDIADAEDAADLTRQIVEAGQASIAVVTLGADGAVIGSERSSMWAQPPETSQEAIRSDAGAGDSLLAGLVLGLARHQPLANAARFGVAWRARQRRSVPMARICARSPPSASCYRRWP